MMRSIAQKPNLFRRLDIRLQLEVDKEVLHRLEQARDLRPLASHEEALRHLAKLKTLGLASLQRSIAR
jgi:hypothetical protein